MYEISVMVATVGVCVYEITVMVATVGVCMR